MMAILTELKDATTGKLEGICVHAGKLKRQSC